VSRDRITELYEREIGSRDAQLRARRRIHWLCGQAVGEDILDAGCSQGIASFLLAREARRVTGVDVDAASLAYAHDRLEDEPPEVQERLEFVHADAGELPLQDGSFDTVLLGEIVEHLVDPTRVLTEAARVLRPGGRAVITTPYGPFRYPDHKEPIYLIDLLELLPMALRPTHVVLIDRYLGLVALAPTTQSRRRVVGSSLWREALEVAERRLRDRDERLELERTSLQRQTREKTELKERLEQARDQLEATKQERRDTVEEKSALEERLSAEQVARQRLDSELEQARDQLARQRVRRLRSRIRKRLGRIRRFLHRVGSRLYGLGRSTRFRPSDAERPDDLSARAVGALREGKHELAHRLAAQAQEMQPNDPRAAFVDAAARWELGTGGDVIDEMERRAESGTTETDLEVAVRFFRHVEDLPRAAELLSRMHNASPARLRDIARALQARGHCALALETSTRALELDPDDAVAASVRDRALGTIGVLSGHSPPGPKPKLQTLESVSGRVLHLLQRSFPHHVSGGTVRSHNLIKAQRQAGIEAHAVTQRGFPWTSGVEDVDAREVVDNVPYHHRPSPNGVPDRLDVRLERNLEAASEVAELVRPSILHPASDYVNGFTALELRARFGLPVIYEVRGFPEERLVKRSGSRAMWDPHVARRKLEMRCWLESDRLVTLARVMKDHMVTRGVGAEKITVIPNAVDPDVFAPSPRDPSFAHRLGIAEDETVLGYVSTLNRYEGLEYLIAATAKLIERGHHVRALIVGEGPSRRGLEETVASLGITDQVTLAGRVEHAEVPRVYSVIDVFVVPRTAEATCQLVMPLKPYEAMAAGRPVVVSGTRVLRELILDGTIGLSFEPEDVTSLADVVEPLIEDPARREELGGRARDWVASERTWRGNAELYRSLYEEIAQGT
jgi:glycosyltransferase involved in cell wall biosynthesis/SAM-dependent methyltransferase